MLALSLFSFFPYGVNYSQHSNTLYNFTDVKQNIKISISIIDIPFWGGYLFKFNSHLSCLPCHQFGLCLSSSRWWVLGVPGEVGTPGWLVPLQPLQHLQDFAGSHLVILKKNNHSKNKLNGNSFSMCIFLSSITTHLTLL